MIRHADRCNWHALEGDEEGFPIVVRVRGEIPPGIDTADYPVLVNLYWRVSNDAQNGMPTSGEMDEMLRMDDLLNEMDGDETGYMMFSITGNHRKEWIWYAKHQDAFLASLNACLSGHPRFPIEIEMAEAGDDWPAYRDIIASVDEG